MKVAKIEHYRCGEPAGKWGLTSYVWIPDEMAEEEFETLCGTARKAYMDAERAMKAATPLAAPGYGATILPNTPDEKTVRQLRAEYETRAKAYKEYQKTVADNRKPFTKHLVEASGDSIKLFWDHPPAVSTKLDWGHNHGTTIEHGETEMQDYPPQKEEEYS
jgi:hypothetical protein